MHKLHDTKGEQRNQLLVTVDEDGMPTGTATRAQCHDGEGQPHLAFLAFVFDVDGFTILTRRSKQKSLWPGYWDSATISHVLPDETPEQAAQRRGREELGIDVEFRDLGAFYYFAKFEHSAENEYCHVLVGSTDQEIVPNPIEVDMIKRVSMKELFRETKMHTHAFTPWLLLALEKFGTDIHQ